MYTQCSLNTIKITVTCFCTHLLYRQEQVVNIININFDVQHFTIIVGVFLIQNINHFALDNLASLPGLAFNLNSSPKFQTFATIVINQLFPKKIIIFKSLAFDYLQPFI